KNPSCVAYDLPFGCPGWVQGIIQGHYYIQSGDVQRVLVVGTETLSRICDPHDRDSMIFSDGAGATILEAKETGETKGILSHATRTDTEREAYYLTMGPSYKKDADDTLYIKMKGRRLYQYALSNVPNTVKNSIDKAGIALDDIQKVLIHQANAKMDQAIMKALFKLYDRCDVPSDLVPMTISWLGNSSVATIPTLLDLILRQKMDGHELNPGDTFIMASVGAGMNINAVTYKM
ncbi:MAG TPA: 3-oxoacyl-[acyl-carrier-protein] synthase III C-terminal domain-containing protein, partial [Balneolaceae bacterium]|nr:3-oxoacyl-[acyl-carrier-protein] synthase III C-terminal domain-containing protein [Balneolaceae bacterium]